MVDLPLSGIRVFLALCRGFSLMELSFCFTFIMLNQQSSVTADLACELDESENAGSCYYFSESTLKFASSKSFCEELGMHLVYIGSQEEQQFLQSSLSGNTEKHWIGLSQMTWIDGSSLDYNNFDHNYIASLVFNDGGICFRMSPRQWFDTRCSGPYYYICENEIEDSAACSKGQTKNDGSCYYFSQSKSNFDSSKSSCDDLGMHLVYIGSEDEHEFLEDNLPVANYYYWIGISSVTWLDGASLTYANFADDSETLDEGGVCFVIHPSKSYQWLDDDCADEHVRRFICEKEGGIQSRTVQHTTPGAATSPEGLTQTTTNQMTSSETSSSSIQTDNIVTTSGSTQPSSTTDDAISETTSSPASTTQTSQASSTSTAGQGSTYALLTSEQATDTTLATRATHTTQKMSSTTRRSSPRDRDHTTSKNFRLLASNVALTNAYVLSSYTVSSIIKCSQLCFADVRCSCYTFIAREGSCLLGKECLETSTYAFERRPGAKFFSALDQD